MKKIKLIFILLNALNLATLTSLAYADGYVSAQTSDGTVTTGSAQYVSSDAPHAASHKHRSHRDNGGFAISVNLPPANPSYVVAETNTYVVPALRHHRRHLAWVDMYEGQPIPSDAVVGGNQVKPQFTLFVCRSTYNGGLHPGKLVAGRCNFGWGGDEISTTSYQVLVSRTPLHWVSASYGYVPPNAVPGGDEHGQPLFICQAEYRNGMHPGKIVGQMCNIGWGGHEISVPYYNVLVR